jgi:CheY-like chemotaxis protein
MGVYNSKLGERKWLSVNADPQFNADGAVQQVVCTLTDISARKLIEAELKRASLAADTANAAKSRFLAAASHDLRQPLSALSLFVSVLRNKAGPDLQGLVGNFQDCVDSLDELLTDLLDISKLEAGAVFWRSANFSVDEFFLALQSVSLVRIQKKHLRMRTRHSDFVAYTDRTLLRRIVGNFVDNAIRYTNQGGVLIACRPHAGKQWIEVWDTGIGIPQDKLTVIFEEFSQLGDGARTQGSGLGLAIARQTANLLGLQIRVRSRLGRGSMFAIELPQGKLENLAPAPLEAASITKKFKIAVLDDNDRVGQAVKMMLEGVGHIVVAATKLSELLVKISTSRPDILVCDYRLTDGHTGFDAIAAVRSLLGPDFPAIIFTGDTDPTLIKSMSRQGVPVLYKPIRADALQAAICAAIESKLP